MWHSISQCIWSSATKIRGKTTLVEQYKTLERFFVGCLGVARLSLKMLYDELASKHARSPRQEVDEALRAFSSLLSSEKCSLDPESIRKAHAFPVRHAGGQVRLQTASTGFAIVDREYLSDAFRGKVAFLDFGIQETHELKPFLEWAGLQRRYLSASVREVTSLNSESTRLVSRPERRLNAKSQALLRYHRTPLSDSLALTFESTNKHCTVSPCTPTARASQAPTPAEMPSSS